MKYAIGFVAVTLLAGSAEAQTVLFKHDQFPTAIVDAADEITGMTVATNQGFAAGEAFGQLYVPDPGDYPLRILGIEMVLAAPPNGGSGTANGTIEFWYHDGTSADPGLAQPTFAISTIDLYDRVNQTFGQPLTGNTAMKIEFDWSDPLDLSAHPPVLTSGNFTVMVRFEDAAQDLSKEWGTLLCLVVPGVSCGCQQVATVQDQVSTTHVNVLNILPSGCSGVASNWVFADDSGVNGDFVLRVRAETDGGTCTPDCTSKDCGDDGCGGSCGTCGTGTHCAVSGVCIDDTCTPDCTNKECGDDGCGDYCGTCAAGRTCDTHGLCNSGTSPTSGGDPDDGGCAQQPGGTAGALLALLFFVWRRRA